ncbi:hypothetical protein B5M09_011529 [Aphanomyces astaci]|nr:hypothetical protein B5M09_011529 [Aphanomyces astaci]
MKKKQRANEAIDDYKRQWEAARQAILLELAPSPSMPVSVPVVVPEISVTVGQQVDSQFPAATTIGIGFGGVDLPCGTASSHNAVISTETNKCQHAVQVAVAADGLDTFDHKIILVVGR